MSKEQNPILNNPYEEPKRHYATQADGSLDYEEIKDGRRIFIPSQEGAPIPKKAGKQKEAFEVNDFADDYKTELVNLIRGEVKSWRENGYKNITRVTSDLLHHWFLQYEDKPKKNLFFAQREALETAIWLNEVADRTNAGSNILEQLEAAQKSADPNNPAHQLSRIAFKMATGTGKTVVMAGLIIYHYLNRQNYGSDTRFADYFLIVAPSITIRDRLGVLKVDTRSESQQAREDYYAERNLVPRKYAKALGGLNARIEITNYHSFMLKTLQGNKRSPFDGKLDADGDKTSETEAPGQMVKRVLGNFKSGRRLLVFNDEAHHCYLPKQNRSRKTTADFEHDENAKAAVWFSGLIEIARKFKVSLVYDLSATPYYLDGSGYDPYSLFPWVVSDFGLVDAIESGLVKIPFLPEKDDTHELDEPVLRNLYEHVKKKLSRKGLRTLRKEAKKKGEQLPDEQPEIPSLVKQAIDQIYDEYNQYHKGYRKQLEEKPDLLTAPPVLIIVCNNTTVSQEVFKFVAGYEIKNDEGETERVVGSKFDLFSNYDDQTQSFRKKPPTILIDSEALDDAGQINKQFKEVFEQEINEFKRDYSRQYGQGAAEQLSDADILREVVNSVGKPGRMGSHIRCVVSVSMLTEGWDANNVTHILGIRAFGSQLLCEQVAGRALRRMDYNLRGYDSNGNSTTDNRKVVEYRFPPEYATIIGVPFKFFKGGKQAPPIPGDSVQIRALPEREKEFEIKFPILEGYRKDVANKELQWNFSNVEDFEIDGSKNPTRTELATAFSDEIRHIEPNQVLSFRDQQVIYDLTRDLMKYHFSDSENHGDFALFGQLKSIVDEWYHQKLKLLNIRDERYKRFILYEDRKTVCDHISRGINTHLNTTEYIRPIFTNKFEKFGSTKYVHGVTTREVFYTENSHVNAVVGDSDWERIFAKTCEETDSVLSYVKNDYLGFTIPYMKEGQERQYYPDFILRCTNNDEVTFNLIVEISGYNMDKDEKKWYVKNRWLPAVNSVKDKYGFDSWHFAEIARDIRDVKNQIHAIIESVTPETVIEVS